MHRMFLSMLNALPPTNATDNHGAQPHIPAPIPRLSVVDVGSNAVSLSDSTIHEQWRSSYEKCAKMKSRSLSNSRRVQFMMRSMANAGCPIDGDSFIECDVCEARVSGAMYEKEGGDIGIVMCVNRLGYKSQDYFDTVVTHELIHAFDACRARTDFANLRHHACTEIRAANLSGECSFTREFKRGIIRFSDHQQACVRRRAVISVIGNPNCVDGEHAKQVVDQVFDRCVNDLQPHGSIPW